MKKLTFIKEIGYKGHTLTKIKDQFGQESVIIDNNTCREYVSFADAKRVINGASPKYEFV